jgi:hypothetical protein
MRLEPGLHFLQALVYTGVAWFLWDRWAGWGLVFVVAFALQVGGALASLSARERLVSQIALLTSLLMLSVYGAFFYQLRYLQEAFGEQTGDAARDRLGPVILAAPYLLWFPLSRLHRHWRWLLPVAILVLLPLLPSRSTAASPPELSSVYSKWKAGTTSFSELPDQALITVFSNGKPSEPIKAIKGSVVLPPPGERAALLIDIPVGKNPWGLVWPGRDAPAGQSPHLFARKLKRVELYPNIWAPQAKTTVWRYQSVLLSEAGQLNLKDGWSPAPELSAASIDTAVEAAVLQLAANLNPDGTFTYIVQGPSGEPGKGYNYPRHAGTCWFLARAAAALSGTEAARVAGETADKALKHLEDVSEQASDGRRYILDPTRKDGKAWAGTTALATMALALRKNRPELLNSWVRQLAASVDAQGKVIGDMRIKDGSFPDFTANPYGQGQVMLALAAAERAEVGLGKEALTRAIEFVGSGRYAGLAHPLSLGDEHWMCLAAHAVREVRGSHALDGVCAAYVADTVGGTPAPGGGLQPAAGPAGGLGEAVIAWAYASQSKHLLQASRNYGWLFLRNQYRPQDAPLLERPTRLIGGFRDTPGELDVQIDAVQHIGSALLGIEALLSGRDRPGSWP